MKILMVSEPGVDGVFRHIEGLTRQFMERGHSVSIAYSSRRDSDRLYRLLEAIKANGGSTLDLKVANDPGPKDLFALVALSRFYRQVQPDIVHAHSFKAGLLTRAARLTGITAPIFYAPHAYYQMGSGKKGLKGRLALLVERCLARIGTTINLSATEFRFARTAVGVPSNHIRTLYNGVDCDQFVPGGIEAKLEARRRFSLPENTLILGTVGRFSEQKDPQTLYRAFEMAARSESDLFLAHLGTGDLTGVITSFVRSSKIGERVRRIDYAPNPAAFYQALDGFVLSSRYEGMSYAILEALATNLPLLLTHAPGNSDFADFNLSHVYWSTVGKPASLASAILEWKQRVLETPNHREIALEKFSEKSCVDGVLSVYEEALSA